ncbi:MAG: SpoIIE family protein phosphatase [Desulfobacterales bacterium]
MTNASTPIEKILLVDDNPINLQVLMETLQERGSRLLIAKDGKAALGITRKTMPDLILLDIMMPEMDGYEVCRHLKADPATTGIPIIFLSAMDRTEDKVSGLKLGAVDYITKPFQPEEVLARVDTHLTIHRLQREVQEQRDQLEHELQTVSQLQRKLLPKALPTLAGLDLAAYYETSRYAGGDYYDFWALADGRIGILVADAEGHSSPAAVLMAMTCALFHSFDRHPGDPEALLVHLNRYLCQLAEPSFVTALYAVYDPQTRSLRAGRAGHGYPVLFEAAKGQAREWEIPGVTPLGIYEFDALPVSEIRLQPGDRFLLYTDGICERFSAEGELYGEHRVVDSLAKAVGTDARIIVDHIMREVNGFAGHHPADDDQALVLGVVA